MSQIWMVPVALLIGVSGTGAVLRLRRFIKTAERDWWVPVVLFWSPLLCWIASQLAVQAH